MKVLVTGATGVVGRRLVPLLLGAGHEVTAVARSAAARSDLVRRGAAAVDLDLFDYEVVYRAVLGHDAVINLATHIPRSTVQMFLPWAWHENDRLRRDASAILVDACIEANVQRFVQESFAPVYPDSADRWIDEEQAISPVTYNLTIANAEGEVATFARSGRVGVVLRFGNFYGVDAVQTADLIRWVRRGWAPFPGPSGAYISSVSHDDAATAAAVALKLPAGVYNVVDDEAATHSTFVRSLADALVVPPPRLPPPGLAFLFGSFGQLMARSVRVSNRKLRSFGWTPRYRSVREGWAAVIAEMASRAHSTVETSAADVFRRSNK